MRKFDSAAVWSMRAVFAAAIGGWGMAMAQSGPSPERAISLTIYKDDFAMVAEQRAVSLDSGRSRLVIDRISKQLDPKSVMFDWLGGGNHPTIVGTNYDLGVGSLQNMMSRLNGQQVEMLWPSSDGKPGEAIKGKLEASQDGGTYSLRTETKLYINPGGTLVAPADSDASSQPTLSVELQNRTGSEDRLGFSYLTRGMSWSADYVARLTANSDIAELQCWATITNTTGIPYPTSRITLMAGSPNRLAAYGFVAQTVSGRVMAGDNGIEKLSSSDSSGFTANAIRMPVGEMYAYKIPAPATIGQDQMNRVSVLGVRHVPFKRDYAIRLPALGVSGFESDGMHTQSHIPASLSLRFVNAAASHLGVPLPGGAVRVYEKDRDGQEQFIGSAPMADTPRKEHVSLTLTDSFDLYGGTMVLDSRKVARHLFRKTVQTVIHNEKDRPVTVRVVQGFDSGWTPVSESAKSQKLDSNTIQWTLRIGPGEDKQIKYVVEVKG